MTSTTSDSVLQGLLKDINSSSLPGTLPSSLEKHKDALFGAFLPTATTTMRSLAFMVLSKVVTHLRPDATLADEKRQASATSDIVHLLSPPIQARSTSTELGDVLSGLGTLAALFQVDPSSATEIFSKDGFIESLMDTLDLFEGEAARQTSRSVASLLAHAAGSKSCRPIIISQALSWLRSQAIQTKDTPLQAAAAVALTKLAHGTSSDTDGQPSIAGDSASDERLSEQETDEALAKTMKALVIEAKTAGSSAQAAPEPAQSTLDAVEVLAYTTNDPKAKEMLSLDSKFLTQLFSLVPSPRKHQTGPVSILSDDEATLRSKLGGNTELFYGIAVIISNIVSFRPLLTEEEKQVQRLQRMTKESARTGVKLGDPPESEEDILETDQAVKLRCKRLIQNGVVSCLVSMCSRSESEGVRRASAKAFLSLVEEKATRGKLVQAGAAKALQVIIRSSFSILDKQAPEATPIGQFSSQSSTPTLSLSKPDLLAIQALAKLAITSSPTLLFGPDPSSSIDAVRPFAQLLLNPASTPLQRFEALMALTNLASLGPALAGRVASQSETGLGSVLAKVEGLLLDDNVMIRRAAVELLSNMISSDVVWERYTGEKQDEKPAEGEQDSPSPKAIANRLRILLAMCDVEDDRTRLAASGALAMLTSARNTCVLLLSRQEIGPERVFRILVDLITPLTENQPSTEPGLIPQLAHRGVVCLRNVLYTLDSDNPPAAVPEVVMREIKQRPLGEATIQALCLPGCEQNVSMIQAGKDILTWLTAHGVETVV